MLRNLSKYYLFICCKQSSSTHFRHFLATAFVTDVLAGSNPMHRDQTKTVPLRGPFPIRWWAMRDVACGWRRPLPLRACGPRVLRWKTLRVSSAPHPVGFESLCDGPKKKGSHCWEPIKSVVGDEGCPRAADAARFRFGPTALACCAGKRFAFPQLRTLSGSNPSAMGLKKRKASIAGGLTIRWWAMRDSNPQPCACKAPALTVAPIARAERV